MKNLIKICFAFIFLSIISCDDKSTENLNMNASLQQLGSLPENPLLMDALTSSIQPNDSTMSTLYGNAIAVEYALNISDSKYPQGAELYELTWKQKPDQVWFGGNVPKEITKVERVFFPAKGNSLYELYSGKPLKKTTSSIDQGLARTTFLVSQKVAVSP